MNSNATKSRADRSPGGPRPGASGRVPEPPARPKVVLVTLAAGLLGIVLVLLAVRATRSFPPGGESEIAQAESPVDQGQSGEVLPTLNNSAEGGASSPNRGVVDPRGPVASFAPESPLSIPDHWGIEITQVGVAAGGKALDLRYKVIDVAKATSLLYLTNFVYIYNQSNRTALMVPFQRENQTSQKLVAGKTYFTLLPNKEERVKSGNTVTVVLGGSRAENLIVN